MGSTGQNIVNLHQNEGLALNFGSWLRIKHLTVEIEYRGAKAEYGETRVSWIGTSSEVGKCRSVQLPAKRSAEFEISSAMVNSSC